MKHILVIEDANGLGSEGRKDMGEQCCGESVEKRGRKVKGRQSLA